MKKILISFILLAIVASSQSMAQEMPRVTVTTSIDDAVIVTENMLARRSIRKYTSEQVHKEDLKVIMECAINAPSAMNKQPWEVRVIQNADILAKIKALNGNFHGAPTLIVIAKDKTNDYSDLDCGLMAQNIMLSAQSLELGTCALGSVARTLCQPQAKEVLKKLDLPANYEPVLCIAIGHPDQAPAAKPRDASKVKYID